MSNYGINKAILLGTIGTVPALRYLEGSAVAAQHSLPYPPAEGLDDDLPF